MARGDADELVRSSPEKAKRTSGRTSKRGRGANALGARACLAHRLPLATPTTGVFTIFSVTRSDLECAAADCGDETTAGRAALLLERDMEAIAAFVRERLDDTIWTATLRRILTAGEEGDHAPAWDPWTRVSIVRRTRSEIVTLVPDATRVDDLELRRVCVATGLAVREQERVSELLHAAMVEQLACRVSSR